MFLTDVIVELGYATRERVDAVIQEARIAGRSADELLVEQQADRRRPALARDRRALRARPRRPQRLPRRHGRGQPALGRGRAPLPGGPGRLRRLQDPARGDRRPRERARDRRHPHDHRPQLPGRGRRRRRHRGADPPAQLARERRHRGGRRGGGGRARRARASCASRPTTRRSSSSSTRSSARRRPRAPPTSTSSPARTTCGSASASTASSTRRRGCRSAWSPASISRIKIMSELDIAEKRVPQDGRVERQRRRAARSTCASSTLPTQRGEGATIRILDKEQALRSLDELGHERRAAASASRRSISALPRRRARHRADRLGQVDVALRGAGRDQLGREEHHHDRGPGRVPDRRRHPDERQPQGRARRSRPGCARSCAPTPT